MYLSRKSTVPLPLLLCLSSHSVSVATDIIFNVSYYQVRFSTLKSCAENGSAQEVLATFTYCAVLTASLSSAHYGLFKPHLSHFQPNVHCAPLRNDFNVVSCFFFVRQNTTDFTKSQMYPSPRSAPVLRLQYSQSISEITTLSIAISLSLESTLLPPL